MREVVKDIKELAEVSGGPVRAYRITGEERKPVTARARGTEHEK